MGLGNFIYTYTTHMILLDEIHRLATRSLLFLGADHQLRADVFVKVLLAQSLELHGALLQRQALLVGILGHFRGHIVPDNWVQAGNKHQTKL